ncbi:hypothetical protein RclHR1_00490037 [Rhizophagus clarus]|uniref:Nucleotide exchange factor Fes1 domain-containing protein n=1 Tax=Rhizophagus clarus TaxID=94130 RepID=A0A2Z6RLB2_9GLOM|nr:hypothetical protein RclHR1_00490037 [Rhizophagus clarus]
MSLWVDEYRPKSLEELTYHSELTKRLKILTSSEDFPHLIVYGPTGAGKKTRISCLLRELYGEGAQKLKTDVQSFTINSSRKLDITVVSSKNHLEITPNEVGFADRAVVQEFLKDVAQTRQVDLSIKHVFKVVVIHEADLLSSESQAALRRTMELYMSNVRLILCCKSPSRIIDPIRSRCLLIRVPAPTIDEIIDILLNIAKKKNVNLSPKVAKLIADQSNRDLRKAILSFESLYMEYGELKDNVRYKFTDWEEVINDIANKINLHYDPDNLESIRNSLYELLNTYILPSNLIKYLFLAIVRRADESVKSEILEKAAEFEHRIVSGSKAIIHIEAFVINAMYIIGRYKNGLSTMIILRNESKKDVKRCIDQVSQKTNSMEKLLKWSIENSDSSGDSPQPPPQNEPEKKIDPGVIDAILGKSDAARIREAVEIISNPNETLENKEIAFDNLEMLVEQIDNAIDIENMNLWPKLLSFLSFSEHTLRKHAVWVCGTAIQNNIRAQKAFAEKGGIKLILNLLKDQNEDPEIRSKALYAISGAIKHYLPGLDQFEEEKGYETLLSLLQTSSDLTILRKTVFLFNTLLLQDPIKVATRIEEKGLSKQLIKLLETYGEDDEDLADKILRTLLAELQYSSKSLSEDEINELKRILPEIKSKYGEVALSKSEWEELETRVKSNQEASHII